MDFKHALDRKITEHNLLNHPFYQAWRAGELPMEALRSYAQEYGAFIATVPHGWETIGDTQTAAEEIEHTDLWAAFAAGLDTHIAEAAIPQVKTLVETATALFAEHATALGALYAFEAQQPATTQSKLVGLKTFYQLPETVEPYFETHARNDREPEMLLERMAEVPPELHAAILQACEQMSVALWNALTGIHDAECT